MDLIIQLPGRPTFLLLPINSLNEKGPRPLAAPTSESTLPQFYLDTNDDNFNSPIDVLLVFLNDPARNREGQAAVTYLDLVFVKPTGNMPVVSVADQHDDDTPAPEGSAPFTVEPAVARSVAGTGLRVRARVSPSIQKTPS